jgi:hypothetical protein
LETIVRTNFHFFTLFFSIASDCHFFIQFLLSFFERSSTKECYRYSPLPPKIGNDCQQGGLFCETNSDEIYGYNLTLVCNYDITIKPIFGQVKFSIVILWL